MGFLGYYIQVNNLSVQFENLEILIVEALAVISILMEGLAMPFLGGHLSRAPHCHHVPISNINL